MNATIFDEAFRRGAVTFVIVFIAGLAANLLIVDLSVREVIGLSLAPAIGAFATRAGYEGVIDSRRARNGILLPSDVPMASDKLAVVPRGERGG